MENDSWSSRKVKDDDSTNSKKKFVNEKGSPAPVSGANDASGLRRSAREASSRKQAIPCSLSTRKSERIEKRTPTSSPIKNKAVKTQNQMTTTPLRRSDRGKKNTLSSSGSKNSSKEPASSDIEQKKEKRQNNLERNKLNVSNVSTSGRQDAKLGGRKRKVMDAHTYKALFKSQRTQDTKADGDANRETSGQLPQAQAGASSHRDVDEEREGPTDFPQADIRDSEGTKSTQDKDDGSEDCSGSKSAVNKDDGGDACSGSISRGGEDGEGDKCSDNAGDELIEECVQRASGGPLGTLRPISSDLDLGGVNGHVEVVLSYSRRKLRFIEGCNEHSGADGIKGLSNGRNDTGVVLADGLRTDSGKRGYAVLTNGLSPSSSGCKGHNFDETCNTCSKKRRINNDLEKEQELYSCDKASKNDLGDTFISKDRGKHEATIVPAEKCDDSASRGERSSNDQGESNRNMCITCKIGGTLRCCDSIGCKRSYHISCLEAPPDNDLPTVWHCPLCVGKIKSGIQGMPRIIESIWDTREMKMSNAEGLEKQKQYFVKYHSLAHVHNEWVAETQLKLQAPLLMEKFNQQNLSIKWNGEWTVPHRLLKKRILLSITPQDYHNKHAGKDLDYHYEWLVEWCGLDNEHTTWESENASFLRSAEGQKLIREYENRHEKEKRATSPVDKIEESLVKLLKLRTRSFAHRVDNIHLSYVKRLHEFWNMGQNIIVFDDEKRIKRIVLFMLSMKHVYQPFLIITSSDLISMWEAEFSKLVLSVDVKVYVDDREAQRNIRILDIYGEDGRVLFQVLLFPVDTYVRDLNMFGNIRWEAVIIDDCQCSKISTLFEQIKTIPTETRILLFCGPAVESVAEYLNLLALVGSADPLTNNTASKIESVDNFEKLKESLARFIAYDCMSDSSKFVEYWVPVYMSNVQLEQYCATLISNSTALCSCLKNDSVGALHDILISTRKCCDHPYIVDPSLQGLLTKEVEPVEYLDVGIKASGKLQILDLILSEMKTQQLRVLILFQAISGFGRDTITIGDILDDFVRQRFGQDSYERVDGGAIVQSKKQAALNNFNKKDMGRFILLLDYRACLPSIKLSSVDSVVIFDSDWNPANDLRALQKITIDSELDQIKIFRLYTPCTVEEKILVLAEENLTLDSKLQNLSRSTSDALLMWGASYLFNKLDEFHSTSVPNLFPEELFINNLIEEFLVIISQKCKSNDTNGSMITRVFQNWGNYIKKLPLFGEQKFQLPNGEKSHIFWRELLNGRNPQWKYLQVLTPRQRKRVQYNEESRMTNTVHDDLGKKRKKILNNCIDSAALKPTEEGEIEPENEVAAGTSANYGPRALPDDRKNRGAIHLKAPLPDPQKSLHQLLKPDVTKLCKILKLSESVRIMVERFLEYVIENHRVNREPETILQAFLISLCWIGASLLKHKIDKKESVALAKKHLNFSCKEEEANSVYTKLQQLKEMFLDCPENQEKLVALKDSTSVSEALSQEPLDARVTGSVPADPRVKVEIEEALEDQYIADEDILLEQGQLANQNMVPKETPKVLKDVLLNNKSKWMVSLSEMNQKEIEEFDREWNTKRIDLEDEYKLNQAFIRTLHKNPSVGLEKLKILEKEFAKKMEEHKQQRDIHLQDLKARQLATETTAAYLSVATDLPASGGSSQNELPSHGSENESQVVNSGGNEDGHQDVPENVNSPSTGVLPEKGPAAQPSSRSSPTNVEFQISCPLTCNEAPHEDLQSYSGSLAQVEIDHLPSVDIEQSDLFMTDNPLAVPLPEPGSLLPTNPTPVKDQSNPPASGLVTEPPCEERILPCTSGSQAPLELAEIPANCSDGATLKNGEVPQNQSIPEPGSELVLEIPCEEQILPGNTQALAPPQLAENLANRSDVSVPLTNGDQPGSYSIRNQNRELHISSQTAEGPPQVPVAVEIPNQASLQPGASLSIIQESGNNNQVPSRVPSHPSHAADPLQSELERLREEKENIIKFHEEMKLRLKSEYDKELAEVTAQIKSKYEVKHQEAEASFHVKKKELDNNLGKVLMNKILAEAFRSKCLDLSSSGNIGMQQVIPATFLQQAHQFSSRPAVRHHATPASTSAGQSSTRHPSSQPVMRHSSVPASTSAGQSSANQQISSPAPVQTVHQASALLSSNPSRPLNINSITPLGSNPSRPLNINSITPSTGNLRVSGEIRAPAPHIRPFRPSSASPSSVASLHRPPNQHAQINLPPTSLALPQASAQPLPPPPVPPQLVSTSLENLKSGLDSQLTTGNLPVTSPSLPQASPQPSVPSPPPLPINLHGRPAQNLPSSPHATTSSVPQASSQPVSVPPLLVNQIVQNSSNSLRVTSPCLPPPSPQPQASSQPLISKNQCEVSAPPAPNSSSLPQVPSQLPLPPLLPPFSTSHFGLYSTSPRPEAAGLSSSTPRSINTRKSAMELLMGINNRIGGQMANNSRPPPPDLPSHFEVLDTSGFETDGNARVSSTDLVCLSDDD